MYAGINFKQLTHDEIRNYSAYLEQYFTFVKNDRLYKHEELFKIFEDSECDVAL
jgi:hypothetical protein